jgi:plastocyanin
MRHGAWLALLLCALGCAALASSAAQPTTATHTVVIENMQFTPAALTVSKGERVVWVNKDLFPHTATADDRTFDSKEIAANASFTYVAAKPGEYPYGCTLHPTMKAKLMVK